jgi:hypothetical protein
MNDMCVLKDAEGRYLVVYDSKRIATATSQKSATRFRPEYARRFCQTHKLLRLRVVRLLPKTGPSSGMVTKAVGLLQRTA